MAKKTKRVEKWRAAAEQQGTAAAQRRGGSTGGRPPNRPSGIARGRQARRSPGLPMSWLIGGLAVIVVAVVAIVFAVRSGDDDTGTELAAVDLTATAAIAAAPTVAATVAPTGDLFGPVPTSPGVALANDGDVASGCWTEAQRTSDGVQALQWSAAPATVIDPAQTYTAELTTNYGTMTWQLLPTASEAAVNNFVCLSRSGYYDGAPFHRIVDDFVIQGGDPTGTGMGGPGYTVPDSPVVGDYSVGMVTMARTAAPNSSGSQFFINTADNTSKFGPNPTYINFARVLSGQETINAIASVERVQGGDGAISSPVSPVILESVTIYQGGLPAAGGGATPVSATPVVATPVSGTPLAAETPGTPIATPAA